MSHSLASARAKIQRAKENIINLKTEIDAFLGHIEPTVSVNADEQSGQHIVGATGKLPPIRFGVLAGEVIHHLRSALDHLAHQLVILNGEIPDTRTEFPIFVARDQYATRHAPK